MKNVIGTKGARLLRKVKRHILEEPKRFFMDGVVMYGPEGRDVNLDGIPSTFPQCGTAACIAGWACVLSGNIDPEDIQMANAERLLGITSNQGNYLFLVDFWPEQFSQPYQESTDLAVRAKIAAERIDHFVKTGL